MASCSLFRLGARISRLQLDSIHFIVNERNYGHAVNIAGEAEHSLNFWNTHSFKVIISMKTMFLITLAKDNIFTDDIIPASFREMCVHQRRYLAA